MGETLQALQDQETLLAIRLAEMDLAKIIEQERAGVSCYWVTHKEKF